MKQVLTEEMKIKLFKKKVMTGFKRLRRVNQRQAENKAKET